MTAPSHIAAFVSDLIDSYIELTTECLETLDERMKAMREAITSHSAFRTFITELWDDYYNSMSINESVLVGAAWRDVLEDENFRWLYEYLKNELDSL